MIDLEIDTIVSMFKEKGYETPKKEIDKAVNLIAKRQLAVNYYDFLRQTRAYWSHRCKLLQKVYNESIEEPYIR